jgi:serine/threonine-protein phosphatase PP1 catalytic subunit
MKPFILPEPEISTLDGLKDLKKEVWNRLELEPNAVEADAGDSVVFVGDLHGCLDCLRGAVECANALKADRIVCLGDYVDRGPEQFETLECVLRLHLAYPKRVTVLRGNHETAEMNRIYGFRSELTKLFRGDMFRAAELCADIYEVLPLVFRCGSYIGLHGGVPSQGSYGDVFEIPKPHSRVDELDDGKLAVMMDEIMWNDPDEGVAKFGAGKRGSPSRIFGEKAARAWLEEAGAEHLVRGHESARGRFASLWDGLVIHLYPSAFRKSPGHPVYGFKTPDGGFRVVNPSGAAVKILV